MAEQQEYFTYSMVFVQERSDGRTTEVFNIFRGVCAGKI